MNDLYLIGNGFDLAHGLKTSYNDFLLWYLKQSIMRISPNKHFEDELIIVDRPYNNPLQDHSSLADLLLECEKLRISIKFKHYFFEQIVKNFQDYKWVDIEYEYYLALLQFYKWHEKQEIIRGDYYDQDILDLNSCFDSIKNKLVEYLLTITITSTHKNLYIESILLEGTGNESQYSGDKLFVNFNYTKTMDLYTCMNFHANGNLVNIHGELSDQPNQIIFGYGDEMDPHYEKIENLNNNRYLKNIKSFGYFQTSNYQQIIRFIEGEGRRFTVKIIGHSCGLSDRILLNRIFEHPNCKAIKIYYYQKNQSENDYFEKTQEISRHFKSSGKGDMRAKIVPFSQSIPLVPFGAKN